MYPLICPVLAHELLATSYACNINVFFLIVCFSDNLYLLSPKIGFPWIKSCFLSWCFLPVIGFNSNKEYLGVISSLRWLSNDKIMHEIGRIEHIF